MPQILRLTLFKIPDPAHVQETLAIYSTLTGDAVKGGKPYIPIAAAKTAYQDERNSGYTVVARTVFESKQDMEYFDTECAAHQKIKASLKDKLADGPPLVVNMDA